LENENINMDLEELFRNKLENSELMPAESTRQNLMKKLARREFVRFNPSRFNIYYLGGIIAAGTVAAVLISSQPDIKEQIKINPQHEEIISPDTTGKGAGDKQAQLPGGTPAGQPEAATRVSGSEAVKEKQKAERGRVNDGTDIKVRESATEANGDSLQKTVVKKELLKPGNNSEIIIRKKPMALFEASAYSGCVPLKVKFSNRSVAYDSCSWTFGEGGYSKTKNPEWIFDIPGEYKITLRIYGSEGSESVSSNIITVYPRPVARFETIPVKPILPDDEISFLNYSADAVRYRWEFGDGKMTEAFEPVHKYSRYANYNVRLVVWSQHGCSDSLLVVNAFSNSGCFVDFPNAFIPNADGPTGGFYSTKSDEEAQIFHPVTSGVSEYQLKIFSKIGILIFESNDINIGWDGYNKGQLCEPGVYIWKVRGSYKNGEPFVKMGDVTLLRN
jgi:PKD repeat protein